MGPPGKMLMSAGMMPDRCLCIPRKLLGGKGGAYHLQGDACVPQVGALARRLCSPLRCRCVGTCSGSPMRCLGVRDRCFCAAGSWMTGAEPFIMREEVCVLQGGFSSVPGIYLCALGRCLRALEIALGTL